MSKEAMKLALEALVKSVDNFPANRKHRHAIWQVREALAEQPAQQEPVAWMYVNKSTHETKFQKHMRDFIDHSLWSEVPLYGEPLANHELQCICGAVWCGDEMVHLPDKHPPAQRTWEEWFKWWRTSKVADSTEAEIDFADFMLIVRAVESEYGI